MKTTPRGRKIVLSMFIPAIVTLVDLVDECDCFFPTRRFVPSMMGSKRNQKSKGPMSAEKGLRDRGFRYVIGSDESGRGCIAGPVVAASCCILTDPLSDYTPLTGVDDSKLLEEDERNRIYEHIVNHPDIYSYSVAEVSNTHIDEVNILKATMDCFRNSIEDLATKENFPLEETYSVVDGKKAPKLEMKFTSRPWVRGDAEVHTIALASIIAKVTRDRIMTELNEVYPEYGFDIHKGYPSRDHIVALHTHGPCAIHRKSTKPVKSRQEVQ